MPDDYVFPGFASPTYTQVPDVVFDELAPRLTESELRVLLYILRRTFGFKKDRDAISITQMVSGIVRRDGERLDYGTGMSRPGVTKGIKGLIVKGVIEADRMVADDGVNQVNVYRLRFADSVAGVVNENDYGRKRRLQGVGNEVDPQETDQQTERQQDISKGNQPTVLVSRDDRQVIERYARDYSAEFRDEAALKSTLTRLTNLLGRSGMDLDAFLDLMQEARQLTQKHSASIRKEAADGSGRKSKMAYFLATLEDQLEKRGA